MVLLLDQVYASLGSQRSAQPMSYGAVGYAVRL
jgi:hypothetical protein